MSAPWRVDSGTARATVVVVDDDRLVLELLARLIGDLGEVDVVSFDEPKAALVWCLEREPDLVITDYQMPELSGTELIAALRRASADAPMMMITASDDRAVRVAAFDAGATDVLTKPIDAPEVRARTRNMLAIRRGQRLIADRAAWLESEVRRATAAIAMRERETILRLSKAAEYRDWETGSHIVRVSFYSRLIGRELGLSEAEQEILFQAAPMHDVGKIGIPDSILLKPGSLEPAEYEVIKEHTLIGHEILGGSSAELLQAAAEIALTHHEQYGGHGYPHGLVGEAIPLRGRIVAVADTFDALTSQRPYKEPWPPSLAWSFIEQHAGTRLDRACVHAFLGVRREADELREMHTEHPQEGARVRNRTGPASAAADGL